MTARFSTVIVQSKFKNIVNKKLSKVKETELCLPVCIVKKWNTNIRDNHAEHAADDVIPATPEERVIQDETAEVIESFDEEEAGNALLYACMMENEGYTVKAGERLSNVS